MIHLYIRRCLRSISEVMRSEDIDSGKLNKRYNTFTIAKQKYILHRRKEDFIKSDLGRELIASQFPRNMDKWQGWDLDT